MKLDLKGLAVIVTAIAGLITAIGGIYLARLDMKQSSQVQQNISEHTYTVTTEEIIKIKVDLETLKHDVEGIKESFNRRSRFIGLSDKSIERPSMPKFEEIKEKAQEAK
jgi:hypothetical protein